jgi:hypothetical protein
MEPGVDGLVNAFRQLTGPTRKEALTALVDELTVCEWRDLRDGLNTRTFRKDIVGHLPFELVLQVFSYLDIGALYRLQVVSTFPFSPGGAPVESKNIGIQALAPHIALSETALPEISGLVWYPF